MSQPITWRSVNGPDPAQAVRPMLAATDGINNAFDSFSKIIQQREAVDANNVRVGDESAKQAFLAKLQGARSPEELQQMQAALAAEQANLGNKSQASTLGAIDQRLTGLQQQGIAEQTFQENKLKLTQAPLLDRAASLAAQGDNIGLIDLYANNPGLRDQGKYIATGNAAVDAQQKAALAVAKDKRETENSQIDNAYKKALTDAIPINAELRAASIDARGNGSGGKAGADKTDSTMGAPGALKAFQGLLEDGVRDKDQRQTIGSAVASVIKKNPAFNGLSVSEVANIANSYAEETGFLGVGFLGGVSESKIEADMKTALARKLTSATAEAPVAQGSVAPALAPTAPVASPAAALKQDLKAAEMEKRKELEELEMKVGDRKNYSAEVSAYGKAKNDAALADIKKLAGNAQDMFSRERYVARDRQQIKDLKEQLKKAM